MQDRDGVFAEEDFLGGAREAPPPQPRPMVPVDEDDGSDQIVKLMPYDKSTRIISRLRTLRRQRLVDGRLDNQHYVEKTLFAGADGLPLNEKDVKMCPATGQVYAGESEWCTGCSRYVMPACMMSALLDKEQRVCVDCVENRGL